MLGPLSPLSVPFLTSIWIPWIGDGAELPHRRAFNPLGAPPFSKRCSNATARWRLEASAALVDATLLAEQTSDLFSMTLDGYFYYYILYVAKEIETRGILWLREKQHTAKQEKGQWLRAKRGKKPRGFHGLARTPN
jgi:hypothetical protein